MATGGSTGRDSRPTEPFARWGRTAASEIRGDYGATVLASFLINAWEASVLLAKVEENGTPFEEFEEIVFEKLLTLVSQPAEE